MGLRTHKQLSNILIIYSLEDPMTLLDWLQQNPNTHLVGECFEVQSDSWEPQKYWARVLIFCQ